MFGNSDPGGYYPDNALYLNNGGTTLTIGSGITVQGQTGNWLRCAWSGTRNWRSSTRASSPAMSSGGTITINAQPFINQGVAQAINGGTLTHQRQFHQHRNLERGGRFCAQISAEAGPMRERSTPPTRTVNLGGTFVLADLGSFNASGRLRQPDRHARQHRTHLLLNGTDNTWVLKGGTIVRRQRHDDQRGVLHCQRQRDVGRGDGQRGVGRGQHLQRGESDGDQRVDVERDGAGGQSDQRQLVWGNQFCGQPDWAATGRWCLASNGRFATRCGWSTAARR